MRRLPYCLLAAALLAPATTTAASATCAPILTDPAGDARLAGAGANSAGLDILSLDVATSRTELVVKLRLGAFDLTGDAAATVFGADRRAEFTVGGAHVVVRLANPALDGTSASSATVEGTPVRHTFAVEGSTLVWRITRSKMLRLGTRKATPTNFLARTTSTVASDVAPDDGRPTHPRGPDKSSRCAA